MAIRAPDGANNDRHVETIASVLCIRSDSQVDGGQASLAEDGSLPCVSTT